MFREFGNRDIADNSWVNASSIGEVEFCFQSFYLRQSGAKPSLRAIHRMEQDSIEHARVSSDRRCYTTIKNNLSRRVALPMWVLLKP